MVSDEVFLGKRSRASWFYIGETLRTCENRSASIIRAVAAYRNASQSTRHKILKERSTTCQIEKKAKANSQSCNPFHHRGVDTGGFA